MFVHVLKLNGILGHKSQSRLTLRAIQTASEVKNPGRYGRVTCRNPGLKREKENTGVAGIC